MQTVSQAWKNAHKQTLLNESFVEVSLDIADPASLVDASSQDNGAVYISDTAQVVSEVDKVIVPYCTLEQNLWLLNGGRKTIPESDYGDCGFIGEILSDADGYFGEKTPTITINFSQVHPNLIPGITITWGTAYDECAEDFVITAYNGSDIVVKKEVVGNKSVKSATMMDIINYDRITIQIMRWCLPNRRPRVEEIFVGINKVYSKADLFNYTHTQTVDPISTALSKMEVRFSVGNVENEYNPYNENGMAKYLMSRQAVKTRYGLKTSDNTTEWIKGGTFYLSEWSAKQNGLTAEFTARDLLEFLSDIYNDNVSTISSRSLYSLALTLLEGSDLPLNDDGTVKWVIDESLRSIYTTAPLPEDTRANCLQLIANAGRCVIFQDRTGTLRIEPIASEISDYEIDSFNSYSRPEITISKPIKQVIVKKYTYRMVSGKLESSTTDVTIAIGDTGESITIDNPLITDDTRATVIGEWVGNHLKNRISLDFNWRSDVRLDALDIIKTTNDYNTNNVRMTEVEFSFNGAFRGKAEGGVM